MSEVTVDSLRTSPVWALLTVKQQGFCIAFVETGDAVEAVKRCYDYGNDKSAEKIASRLLRNWKIRKLMGATIEGGLITRKELLSLMSDRLRDPKTDSPTFLKMSQNYITLMEWVAKPKPTESTPEPETEDDFDRVLAAEQKRKNGKESR